MEHLFSAWQEMRQRLKAARHVLFLSDYDGTLTPIVERPELANLSPETKGLLQELARQRHCRVGIVSGRALRDLQQRVGIRGIIYAGNHGLEIEGPGIRFVNPVAEEMKSTFRLLHLVLSKVLAKVSGVFVEDKGFTLSVHDRLVAEEQRDEVKNIFDEVVGVARSLGKIRITTGKRVYEVRPAVAWDKGKAIKLLMKKYGKGGRRSGLLPIYLGDDLTDEDGFRVIERYGDGVSIFVGEEPADTSARYFLRSPAEVEGFLGMLLERPRKVRQGV